MSQVGTVKWFNATKGFGFIMPDDGSNDVFVHISAVEQAGMRSLNEGQKVEYELQENRGKQAAGNLKAVD
ncbi:MAG: cold-shock protein [Alphaproteobacteria bacterium]|nr:cold-shock protein [Alphaproteobacteria bacterium]